MLHHTCFVEYGTEEVYGRSLEEEYAVSPTSGKEIFLKLSKPNPNSSVYFQPGE